MTIADISPLAKVLASCDAVIIGAGAGLSAAAGLAYSGARFHAWFADFEQKYGFHDMYSGGFYPYEALEEYWAFWARSIMCNRYIAAPGNAYDNLLTLVGDKDYFVLTTNVDHQFQQAGFEKERLFYTQGDYGLFQCSRPCCAETWDNEQAVRAMLAAEQAECTADSRTPGNGGYAMRIPSELVPLCPHCKALAAMNLRVDNTFVEDEGWRKAQTRYQAFLKKHQHDRVLYWELGVGFNTPGIIKYPFWQMTMQNENAIFATVNLGEASVPREIASRAIAIDESIDTVLEALRDVTE